MICSLKYTGCCRKGNIRYINNTPHPPTYIHTQLPSLSSPSTTPSYEEKEKGKKDSSTSKQNDNFKTSNKKASAAQTAASRGRSASKSSLGTEAKSEIKQQKRERSTAATTTTRVKKKQKVTVGHCRVIVCILKFGLAIAIAKYVLNFRIYYSFKSWRRLLKTWE